MARIPLGALTTLNLSTHLDPQTADLYGVREFITAPAFGSFSAYTASTPKMTFDASWNLTLAASLSLPIGGAALVTNGATGFLQFGYLNAAVTSTTDAFVTYAGASSPLNLSATNGSVVISSRNIAGCGVWIATGNVGRAGWDSSGNFITAVQSAAPTLGVNQQMSFQLVSNTSLKILVRGTDGVTRSATLTLA